MTTQNWDVVVIGAGAAGLLAAYKSAERGLSTLLLEKNRKIGVKILMSGGTRCNVTHNTDIQGIVAAYGRPGKFLHSALAAFGPEQIVSLLDELGVPTKVESTGKVFPASNRAIDIRDALVRLVETTPCQIRTQSPVIDFSTTETGFELTLGEEESTTIFSKNIIMTTGGKSYAECGTTGDGYVWAKAAGHKIIPTVPALAPIVLSDAWPKELSGITLEDVALTVSRGKKVVEKSRDSFLFTHFGLSGPAPMNVSRAFHRFPPNEVALFCDFCPNENLEQLKEILFAECKANPSKAISVIFSPKLPQRFVQQVLTLAGIDPSQRCSEVSHKKLNTALQLLKRLELNVDGTRGFKKAEVTAGGVHLKEVDSSTMQSKLMPGLYFAGEILDLDGPIGGYNFQAAFSTGWLAGSKVAIN